jgi:hypothetical protein
MDNAISNQDIRGNHACSVDKVCAILDSDGQVLTESGLKSGAVLECAGVSRRAAVHDVIRKDVLQILLFQTFKGAIDGSECLAGGRKYSKVGGVLNGINQASCVDCATEGGQVCGSSCIEDADRESENTINNVDYAAGEVEILEYD